MGTVRRGRGKIVYKITWEHEGQEFVVPVRLFKVHDYNTGENRRAFVAEYEDADINIEETDSAKLDKKVIEKLKEWAQIEWKLHLVVEVAGGSRSRQGGAQFDVGLEYDYWAVGTHASTGKEVMMHVPEQKTLYDDGKWDDQRYCGQSPKPVPKEWGREKPSDHHRHFYGSSPDPATKTMILATPANRAALDHFMEAMQVLLDRMHESFHPDRIAELLSSPGLILPAPPPKPKAKKKGRAHASR